MNLTFYLLSLSFVFQSSNLTWKPHIYSIAKHFSQKLGFLSGACGFFLSSQLLTLYRSWICPLEYCSLVCCDTSKPSLHLLDKVKSKAICLITKSLQYLSNHHLVSDLSIFYQYFMDIAHWKSRIGSPNCFPIKH